MCFITSHYSDQLDDVFHDIQKSIREEEAQKKEEKERLKNYFYWWMKGKKKTLSIPSYQTHVWGWFHELKERNVSFYHTFTFQKENKTMKNEKIKTHETIITQQVCNVDNPKDVIANVATILMNTNSRKRKDIASLIILTALDFGGLALDEVLGLIGVYFTPADEDEMEDED